MADQFGQIYWKIAPYLSKLKRKRVALSYPRGLAGRQIDMGNRAKELEDRYKDHVDVHYHSEPNLTGERG